MFANGARFEQELTCASDTVGGGACRDRADCVPTIFLRGFPRTKKNKTAASPMGQYLRTLTTVARQGCVPCEGLCWWAACVGAGSPNTLAVVGTLSRRCWDDHPAARPAPNSHNRHVPAAGNVPGHLKP